MNSFQRIILISITLAILMREILVRRREAAGKGVALNRLTLVTGHGRHPCHHRHHHHHHKETLARAETRNVEEKYLIQKLF